MDGLAAQIAAANGAEAALRRLETEPVRAIVFDLACGPRGELLRLLRAAGVPLLAVAAPGVGTAAADAIAAGALLLARPIARDTVAALLDTAFAAQRRDAMLAHYRRHEAERSGLAQLIGESAPMLRVKTQLRLLLDDEAHSQAARGLLVQGECGSGKEQLARALHFSGARRAAPFVGVEVHAPGARALDAQLFGNAPGAGTGLIELADGGTLFIGEIGDVPPLVQQRLAELHDSSRWDVRVVAASRFSLEHLARSARLLPALQRCLAAGVFTLAPLRERGGDVGLLARSFIRAHAARHGTPPVRISRSARAVLERHGWPGNVRELRHALEHALLLQTNGVIESRHLGLAAARTSEAQDIAPDLELRQLEREALIRALGRAHGNVSRAARLLGLTRDTLRYRIAKHDLRGQLPTAT